MLNRKVILFMLFFPGMLSFQACMTHKNNPYLSPTGYDFTKPAILYLDDALLEISGLCYYPKDTSVFAISDENGYLFKIHLNKKIVTQGWHFGKSHDYESVIYRNGLFYVLASNGDIHEIKFSDKGDTITSQTTLFDPSGKRKDEFESLYYDAQRNSLVLICKKCGDDKANEVSAWAYQPETATFTPSVFVIDSKPIAAKTGQKKLKFEPSAATINPVTGDVWILSSANEMLVITDRNGNCKEAYLLNPGLFTQPEGIAFTPNGDLMISNEAGSKYNQATLLIFKRKTIS